MQPPDPLLRVILHGAAALAAPALLGLVARLFGADQVVMILITCLGIIAGLAVAIGTLGNQPTALIIAAVILMVTAPMAQLVLIEGRPFGPILRLPVEAAGARKAAAGFILTDGAMPRSDLREVVAEVDTWTSRRGGQGRRQDSFLVAPVVPPGWTPDQPVAAVAVLVSRSELGARAFAEPVWAPSGGLLRQLDDALQTRAVRHALQRRGLTPARHIVIGAWVPNPGWARLTTLLPAMAALGGAVLLWIGIVLLGRLLSPARRG